MKDNNKNKIGKKNSRGRRTAYRNSLNYWLGIPNKSILDYWTDEDFKNKNRDTDTEGIEV